MPRRPGPRATLWPGRWILFLLLACSRPGGPPSVNGDPDNAWPALPALDDAIVEVMEKDRIAGLSACIVVDGAIAWCGGYGDRDPDSGAPALPSTPFLLASVSKAVTAVAAMQAVEEGVLDLDASVNETLPFEVVHPDTPGRDITLRHLLAHTAGIADNWDVMDAHYVDGDSSEPLGEFLEGYLVRGGADYSLDNYLVDGVGGVTEYSNIGVALAGYLVEAGRGVPFDDACDTGIFEPLGMEAGWHLADFDASEVALPTLVEGGEFVTVPHFGVPDYPDGQLRANAPSMARFLAMVQAGGTLDGAQILAPASVEELLTPQYRALDDTQGLAWYSWTLDGEEVWGHNGGETGTSTEILFRERDGVGVVVLMNSEGRGATLEDVERACFEAAGGL